MKNKKDLSVYEIKGHTLCKQLTPNCNRCRMHMNSVVDLCYGCEPGYVFNSSDSLCYSCLPGYIWVSGTNSCQPINCSVGYTVNLTSNTCVQIICLDPNCVLCSSTTVCIVCASGYQVNSGSC